MEKKKKVKWRILVLLLLLIAAGAVGYWYRNRNPMDEETRYWFDKMAKDGTLKGKTQGELQDMLNNIVEEGMFNVSINIHPVFERGDKPGMLAIENTKENHFYCSVDLIEDKTQDVLYQSNGIKPGQYIDEVKLDRKLAKGEYDCTAVFTATDPDTLEDVGKVNIKVVLKILN